MCRRPNRDAPFAALRECYNRRTQDPGFQRLTFCLLGVASPSDLIRDTRLTPFNIGRRIELTDFTEAEAAPLAEGLYYPSPCPLPEAERGSAPGQVGDRLLSPEVTTPSPLRGGGRGRGNAYELIRRILYWTGGHPYLTQRLCQAVAADPSATGATDVDRHCEALFLTASAREKDDNLLFVRERLLKSEGDLASLLDLYGRVRTGKRVLIDETNQLIDLLRLSGVVRGVDGRLQVRNRIYARVFDREWILQQMPDAELRRQRAAYRRGLIRATAVSGAILAVVSGLAVTAVRQSRRAEQERARAQTQARSSRRERYAVQMSLAGQALDAGSGRAVHLWDLPTRRVVAILPGEVPNTDASALAFSPDGRLLAYAGMLDPTAVKLWDMAAKRVVATLPGHVGFVFSIAVSPDGKTLATASGDNTVRLWNMGTRRLVGVLTELAGTVGTVAFSPDGKLLATGSGDGVVRLWDVASQKQVSLLKGHQAGVQSVAFTPDGQLASGSNDHTVKLWNTARGRDPDTLRGHSAWVWSVAFSPDSKTPVSGGGFDRTVQLWDVATGRAIRSRKIVSAPGARGGVAEALFSPNGRYLAFCGVPPAIQLWDAALRHEIGLFEGHTKRVDCLAFSPNGKLLASGSDDNTVRLWDVTSRREVARLAGLSDINSTLVFSPDGESLALISAGTVRLWDLASRRATDLFPGDPVAGALAFSPDGRTLVAGGSDGRLRWWDRVTRQRTAALPGHAGGVAGAVFSPDGKELATVGFDNTVRLWNALTRQKILALKGHDRPVNCVAFSPDGNTLATAGADKTVRLWRAPRIAESAMGSRVESP